MGIPFKSSNFVKSAEEGNAQAISLFLSTGMRPQTVDTRRMTPLQVAVGNGHTSLVEALLEHKVSINQVNGNGLTPLMAAAWNGHTDIVHALLNHGADISVMDNNGYTAITYPEEDQNETILALLRQAIEKP